MTSPAPSGGSSPLRVGGLALLGVGAVAALIGVASLVGGGGSSESTTAEGPAPTSAAAPAAPTPDAPPQGATSGGEVPVPSFEPTPHAVAAPNGSGSTGSGGSSGSGASGSGSGSAPSIAKVPVRVYNNSTIKGLAARAAEDVRAMGWPVETVDNYSQGIIPVSTVYYRPGTGEQSSAEALGRALGVRVEPRFSGLANASPGLIFIVTNNYTAKS
ncbi:LytR cell envelope-related transcriptional attenuator [Pseudonocardia thermophila]|uniref:LytR cell envelope-related transcriptional attenuator n=1 Tax=Pseudonocardia thermophila TaxID=1848 RepID=A0A1M6RR99_PSETH|nr:LytR cell envelope-related transcriptional attenuator [Pseudonocardia thermophila]